MSVFRRAPAPPPSVRTDELEAAIRGKKRGVRALGAGFALVVVGLFGWTPLHARIDAYHRRAVPLSAGDRDAVLTAVTQARRGLDAHEAAFRAFWPAMVSGTVGARPERGPCPLRIPSPTVHFVDSRLTPGASATVVEGDAHAPVRWLVIDATARAVGEGVGVAVPASFTRLAAKATTQDAATSSVRIDDLRAIADGLALQAARPVPLPDHADLVARARRLAAGDETVLDFVVVVDAWTPPRVTSAREYEAGSIRARAFVWEPLHDRVTCAASIAVESSKGIAFREERRRPTADASDELEQDLVTRFAREFADGFVGVGPTVSPSGGARP